MTRYSNDSFQLHAIVNGVNMSGAVTLRCLRDLAHNLNIATVGPDTGNQYDEVRFQQQSAPELLASVAALQSLLDEVSLGGVNCITADGTRPGVRAFMQSHNACSPNGRDAGSAHQRVTIAIAQLMITQIGGQKQQTAYASVRVIEKSSDGDEDPDVIVYNAALPSPVIDDEEFVIDSPAVGGYSLADEHVLGWNINTGITATVIVPGGGFYPVTVDITKTRPIATIQHDDASLCDALKIPKGGLECALADTLFPLRRRDPFGGLVARDQAQHILIGMAGYAYHSRRYEANGSAVATGEITIEGIEGAGGVALSVQTNTAIDFS